MRQSKRLRVPNTADSSGASRPAHHPTDTEGEQTLVPTASTCCRTPSELKAESPRPCELRSCRISMYLCIPSPNTKVFK